MSIVSFAICSVLLCLVVFVVAMVFCYSIYRVSCKQVIKQLQKLDDARSHLLMNWSSPKGVGFQLFNHVGVEEIHQAAACLHHARAAAAQDWGWFSSGTVLQKMDWRFERSVLRRLNQHHEPNHHDLHLVWLGDWGEWQSRRQCAYECAKTHNRLMDFLPMRMLSRLITLHPATMWRAEGQK